MLGVHSPRDQINFYYMPKCACTFARQLWYHLHDADRIEGTVADFHNILNQFLPESATARGYAVTRNPYDRVVSMYTNLVCCQYIPGIHAAVKSYTGEAPLTFINFCQYLWDLKIRHWAGADHHLLPQTMITAISKSITRASFGDGRLVIIRCAGSHSDLAARQNPDQYLAEQYKAAYYTLTGSRRFDDSIDQFLTLNRFKNVTPRLSQFEGDATQIEMVGWKEFPPIEAFLTPAAREIITQIYADDFELLGYPTTLAPDLMPPELTANTSGT